MKTSNSIVAVVCTCLGLAALISARGGCYPEPACPDLYIACPSLECPGGFKVDKGGCAICECVGDPASVVCWSDADCAEGQICQLDPACYAPAEANTDAEAKVSCTGSCVDPQPVRCGADFECAPGLVCIDGLCLEQPHGCLSDRECAAGEICDTINYCDPAPGCFNGDVACPAMCYGRCVTSTTTEECWSDADCAQGFYCVFDGGSANDPAGAPCDSTNGDCLVALLGKCVRFDCPDYAPPYCPSGIIQSGGIGPDGCPLPPICVDDCSLLSRDECALNQNCMLVEVPLGMPCYCEPCQDTTDPSCACSCPEPGWACVPRTNNDGCELLDESSCLQRPDCQAIYEEVTRCTDCDPTTNTDCRGGCTFEQIFVGCKTLEQPLRCLSDADCPAGFFCAFMYANGGSAERPCLDQNGDGLCDDGVAADGICQPIEPPPVPCRSDAECGPGAFCNLCPIDPNCPMCDVCGPAVCEPISCAFDTDCPAGTHCEGSSVCPPEAVCFWQGEPGICVPGGVACSDDTTCARGEACVNGQCLPVDPCAGLDEQACLANAPTCQPIYVGIDCACPACEPTTSNECPPCDCRPAQQFAQCVSAPTACIQVIAYATDPATGACVEFATPCDVPEGWAPCELRCDANGVCTTP